MGILLKDQKVLYSDLNLGVIDDSGDVPDPPTPPTPSSELPSNPFAVYDKRSAPVLTGTINGTTTTTKVYSWADQSGNSTSHPMTIKVDDNNSTPAALWQTDHLWCGANLRSVRGKIDSVQSNAQGNFTPASGYTLCALVGYTEPTGKSDDPIFKPNVAPGASGGGQNGGDIVFSVAVASDSTRSQYGIGERYGSSATELNQHYHRLFYYGNTGTSEMNYQDTQLDTLAGMHMLAWVVNEGCTQCDLYCDATLVDTITITKSMSGTSPNIYMFAAHDNVPVSNNVLNFFGACYAACVYNRALSSGDIKKVADYWQEMYPTYNAPIGSAAEFISHVTVPVVDPSNVGDEIVAPYKG